MKKYKFNKEANKQNIKTFKLHYYQTEEEIYTCVLCNNLVSLHDSMSNGGDRLICTKCYYDKFDNWHEACKFMKRRH